VASATGVAAPAGREPALRRTLSSIRAYRYRVPYCVPQWSGKTIWALLRSVLTARVVAGTAPSRLARRLEARLGSPAAVPCANGRTAIELALRGLGVREGSEVVLPSFCCTSILPPVRALGAVPVLADVGDELNLTPDTVEAALTARTRAVIVPHLFGNPADIEGIRARCHPRRVAVIDDAAQAMGATLNGRSLGTFGDAGVVSFGNGKVCFGTGGGALLSSRPEVVATAMALALPSPGVGQVVSHALSVLLWRRWRRSLLPFQMALRKIKGNPPAARPYFAQSLANLDAEIALSLLDRLEGDLPARRARVAAYAATLGDEPRLSLVAHGPGSACLNQVVVIGGGTPRSDAAPRVIAALRSAGYEVERSYIPLHLRAEPDLAKPGALPRTERVWDSLVELPCEPSVTLADIARISNIVRETLRRS
jgi:dTDP-4-amino-4,6-dideoxygalactose transaminase